MTENLAPHQAEWLSLIGYQLRTARAQADQAAPLNALAISSLHDAVESLLSLSAESLGANVKNRADFIQLFDAVGDALTRPASVAGHRSAMNALNQARVGFKHHGNRVDEQTLRRHFANAENFLADLTDAVFSVRLEDVSLLLFIRDPKVRQRLESAGDNWANGNHHEAMQDLWIAFDELVTDYQARKSWHPGKTLFSTKPSFLPSVFDLRKEGKVAEKTFEWLESLDSWVRILAIGVDARRYAYFNSHTPNGFKVLSGDVRFQWRPEAELSDNVFLRCQAFVVDTALELAEDDFTFDAWSARQAARAAEEDGT